MTATFSGAVYDKLYATFSGVYHRLLLRCLGSITGFCYVLWAYHRLSVTFSGVYHRLSATFSGVYHRPEPRPPNSRGGSPRTRKHKNGRAETNGQKQTPP